MTAAIFSIGTELTRGELVNSNAAWLSEQLTDAGFEVAEHLTVADSLEVITSAMKRLSEVHNIIVCTGGLGPTTDDLTTEAAARALNVPLIRDEASVRHIQERFATIGREMPLSNVKQADFPQGADILANPVGTAPGFAIRLGSADVFFMPGVPYEMKQMFETQVRPRLPTQGNGASHQVHLRTFGKGESQVGEMLFGLEQKYSGLTIGYRAHFPEIEVKLHVRAESATAAEAIASNVETQVRHRLGDIVFGGKHDTFAGYVINALKRQSLRLAVAESCTGGLIGKLLTDVPGASDVLLFDAVTYANSAKHEILGVPNETLEQFGAVSAETVMAMAEGVLGRSEADVAIAVSGIAGPGGGTDEKPVGTAYFGFCKRGEAPRFVHRKLFGDRERFRTLAAYVALRWLVEESAADQAGDRQPLGR